ncbi:hypothetical protein A1332_16820 [Methylomonas methanica]|uniref:Uncharacterized protein n=1 Tax=Methylomonas methanica TaxID=421 RepID=A0A177M7X3_METMH|nr:hypothetical protein A1332_16820 [Methylomonas methanica]
MANSQQERLHRNLQIQIEVRIEVLILCQAEPGDARSARRISIPALSNPDDLKKAIENMDKVPTERPSSATE